MTLFMKQNGLIVPGETARTFAEKGWRTCTQKSTGHKNVSMKDFNVASKNFKDYYSLKVNKEIIISNKRNQV